MIEFENVSFSYEGQEHGGLHGISLKIADGECVLFCGRSGCGKTTVTSSKDGDCRGALTLESTLYRIHTGDNAWKPTADSGLENVEMSVSFAEESAGVTVI